MFRRPGSAGSSRRDVEDELRELEAEAKDALPGFEAQLYNRAGDLCTESGMTDRANGYYGAAIDAFLKAGRYTPAGAVCRKLLRLRPRAVRPRCTLAWLSIGKGHTGDARTEVADYAEAARRAGQGRYAGKQLRLMGEAVADPELRELIAEQLEKLGDDDGAAEVRASSLREKDATEDRWERVLRAALMGPGELDS